MGGKTDHSLSAKPGSATPMATLTADEQSARRTADLFAESFAGDEAAVSLVDAGAGQWCVTVFFRAAPDEAALRALAATAAGPQAGSALLLGRLAAQDL